ncbi:MAG: TMEM43 family protein, partial [Rudaea sp.]
MTRKKKISPLRIAGLVAIALLIALGVWAWQRWTPIRPIAATTSTELALPAQTAPGASVTSGVSVQVSGKLQIAEPPRDAQLGVSAGDAVILLRSVAMYQWQEHCDSGGCRYATEWSAQPVDSNRFRARDGHNNPKA